MARRRHTVSRAFVLLIVGIGIGAALFVSRRLSPEAIKAQVQAELVHWLQQTPDVSDVELDLESGVALLGLVVRYPDGKPALEAERVRILVDHRELIGGRVRVRQVDLDGLRLYLRRRAPDDDLPGLPGVFREGAAPGGIGEGLAAPLPLIRVRPGSKGSRVVVEETRALASHESLVLDCDRIEAAPNGPLYDVRASFSSPFLGPCEIGISLDTATAVADCTVEIRRVAWERSDLALLAPAIRRVLPPIELGGSAAATVEARVDLDPLTVLDLRGGATLTGLRGAFGNFHTGERAGLPFGLEDATCTVAFDRRHVRVPDFRAVFVSPEGTRGEFGLELDLDLEKVDEETDFVLRGKGVRASTSDLRLLVPPDLVESIVDIYLPAGTFDFEIDVQRAEGVGERVVADLHLRDGEFNYAGKLDKFTNRRFGFRYPLDRCEGRIHVETNIATQDGPAELFELREMRGYNRIAQPDPGRPPDVAVRASARVLTWEEPEDPDAVAREDVTIDIEVSDLPIDAKLATAFASTPTGSPYRAFDLDGWADTVAIRIRRDAYRDPGPTTTYDIALRDCSIAYEAFPLRVEGVHGRVRSEEVSLDGRDAVERTMRIEELSGTALDGGTVTADGVLTEEPGAGENLELSIVARDLVLGRNVGRALRLCPLVDESVGRLWYDVRPFGTVDALVEIGTETPTEVVVRFDGRAGLAGYGPLECPVTGLRGKLRFAADQLEMDHLEGRIEEAPIVLDGSIDPVAGTRLSVQANALPMNPRVCALAVHLAPGVEPWLDRLALTPDSRLDILLSASSGTEPDGPLVTEVRLDALDLETRILGEPLRITGGPVLAGLDRIEARDVRLTAGPEVLRVREALLPRGEGREWSLTLDARDISPHGAIRRYLGSEARGILGDNLRMDLHGLVVRHRPGTPRVEIAGEAELRRHEVRGGPTDVLEPTGRLRFDPLRVNLPDRPDGPLSFTGIAHFSGTNMNLPLGLRDFGGELRISEGLVTDELSLKGAVLGGEAVLYGRKLDRLSMNVEFLPEAMRFTNIDARLYEGSLRGSAAVYRGAPAAFDVRVNLDDVELGRMFEEEISRDQPMSGLIDAALEVRSPTGDVEDLEGEGEIRIREGQLFRVPGIRAVLSVLSRVTPLDDDPRFRQASADFTIDGETLDVSSIHLSTSLNDVHAQGTISIYGDLELEIEPQVTRLIDLPRLINIPVLSTIRDLWHKTVYGIWLEGTVESPQIRLRPLPWLGVKRKPFVQTAHAGRPERMPPRTLP